MSPENVNATPRLITVAPFGAEHAMTGCAIWRVMEIVTGSFAWAE